MLSGARFPAPTFQRRLSSADGTAAARNERRDPSGSRLCRIPGENSGTSAHTYSTAAAFPTLRRHSDLTTCGAAHSHAAPLSSAETRRRRCSQHPRARGPSNPHVNPLIRAWAAPPTLQIAGSRATERVTARNSVFTCDQHATTDAESAKVQTHSAKTGFFHRFSPNGSALWRPHPLDSRPRRHQSGGIALHGGSTRRRHAARRLRVVQNPHRHQPEVRRIAYKAWHSTGWREKTRPTPPLQ